MITVVFCVLPLQCETIVEQHEDEIIEFFAHETDNVKDKLCSKRTGQNFLLHLYYIFVHNPNQDLKFGYRGQCHKYLIDSNNLIL